MEMEQPQQFDWANDAFTALVDPSLKSDKWPSMNNQNFTIPPSLLSQASIERYGQVTPPEELSPASPPRELREGSIPVEQLRNEPLWLEHQQSHHSQQGEQPPSPKRRRTARAATASQGKIDNTPQQDADPQPPKRKRGRPKSQPQMVEAFTADGFPFQVSSARHTHLEKNRVAAHKCRQRKKEYINSLEGRAREFSSKNKALKENVAMLREEVLGLKNEVLRHAGCGFWAVDEYLARCAGDLLGMEAPKDSVTRQHSHFNHNSAMSAMHISDRHDSMDSIPSLGMKDESSPNADDFGGLELLQDFDDDDMDDLDGHQ